MQRKIGTFTALISAFAAALALAQGAHPGTETDCSTPALRCSAWEAPAVAGEMHGTERWRDSAHRDLTVTTKFHELWLYKDSKPVRWAQQGYEVHTIGSNVWKTDRRELVYWEGDTKYEELCVLEMRGADVDSEIHHYEVLVGGERTRGWYVQWYRSRGSLHQKSGVYRGATEVDAPVQDTSRCHDANFPFAWARDTNLRPLQ